MLLRSIIELMESLFEEQKNLENNQTDFDSENFLKVTSHSLKEICHAIETFLRFLA